MTSSGYALVRHFSSVSDYVSGSIVIKPDNYDGMIFRSFYINFSFITLITARDSELIEAYLSPYRSCVLLFCKQVAIFEIF